MPSLVNIVNLVRKSQRGSGIHLPPSVTEPWKTLVVIGLSSRAKTKYSLCTLLTKKPRKNWLQALHFWVYERFSLKLSNFVLYATSLNISLQDGNLMKHIFLEVRII